MLCVLLAFAVACGNIEAPNGPNTPNGPTGGGDKLAAVSSTSVTFSKEGESLWVSWQAVTGAQSYEVKCGSASVTTQTPIVDLATMSGFSMPTSGGKITVTIIAKGDGYKNSSPTSATYEEGKQVRSPEITSFTDGIIKWKKFSTVKKTTIMVNGTTVAETASNTFDVNTIGSNFSGYVKLEIIASNDSSSAALALKYNTTTGKLYAMPITDYIVNGEVIKWSAVNGATGYKVVDLDFNSYVVTTTHYIMTIRNLVYGVYPVMPASSGIESAEIDSVDIKYLDGSGTVADPYIIKTPFDVRAIDYYELKSSEAGNATKNNYKIANDIDYNTVSALEADSNMFTLRKPFFGVLDGNNKTLSNISVNYNNGFWSMFEFIAKGGIVRNVKFSSAEINNSVQDNTHPINAAIAVVAYRSYGTVSGVTLSGCRLTAKGGGVAGLVNHNYGIVESCTVTGCNLKQNSTGSMGTAAYEMAGVVLENYGTVSDNTVNKLTISGASLNAGSSAGVVAINRAGGTVGNNSFNDVTISNVKAGKEAGGLVAYCATGGNVNIGTGTLGTLTVNSSPVTVAIGTAAKPYGKQYGKKG